MLSTIFFIFLIGFAIVLFFAGLANVKLAKKKKKNKGKDDSINYRGIGAPTRAEKLLAHHWLFHHTVPHLHSTRCYHFGNWLNRPTPCNVSCYGIDVPTHQQ